MCCIIVRFQVELAHATLISAQRGPCRLVKEDINSHGKRIKEGCAILLSMLYARACCAMACWGA